MHDNTGKNVNYNNGGFVVAEYLAIIIIAL